MVKTHHWSSWLARESQTSSPTWFFTSSATFALFQRRRSRTQPVTICLAHDRFVTKLSPCIDLAQHRRKKACRPRVRREPFSLHDSVVSILRIPHRCMLDRRGVEQFLRVKRRVEFSGQTRLAVGTFEVWCGLRPGDVLS